jgi:hypothetical protein
MLELGWISKCQYLPDFFGSCNIYGVGTVRIQTVLAKTLVFAEIRYACKSILCVLNSGNRELVRSSSAATPSVRSPDRYRLVRAASNDQLASHHLCN